MARVTLSDYTMMLIFEEKLTEMITLYAYCDVTVGGFTMIIQMKKKKKIDNAWISRVGGGNRMRRERVGLAANEEEEEMKKIIQPVWMISEQVENEL